MLVQFTTPRIKILKGCYFINRVTETQPFLNFIMTPNVLHLHNSKLILNDYLQNGMSSSGRGNVVV